ncbi:MAG: metal ABC transporter substrate-binding protein, partial [Nitrospiria bacterium]
TNLIRNVAGDQVNIQGIVPEGTNSHTFEPSPSDIKYLAAADLLIYNGLHLEIPTEKLAHANKKAGAVFVKLGDQTITKKEWQFDFSFPKSEGHPNPHLWLNVAHAMKYTELIRDALVARDPANKADYERRATAYLMRLVKLDKVIMTAMSTIPEKNRKLVTYHDSWAYFCPRYGCEVIGAIQPSSFADPSPREMARLIDQLKAAKVPAIFGSEVFPSKILNQIGKEAGVQFVSTLRDDDLPGKDGSPENTYIGMMLENVRTMATVLGGSAAALNGIDPSNQQ